MDTTPDVTELLAHARWVRALARRLSHDEASADDLAQETWLRALERPPARRDGTRPWLGEVLRNARRMAFRAETRRARREEATQHGAEEHAPSTEMLGIEVELGRMLAAEVLALDEPYREAVLLAFYRGLSSVEIGAQLRVPPGTVRWRIKTGLDRLRERLDQRYGGDAAWRHALLPLCGPLLPSPPLATTTTGGAMTKLAIFTLLTAGAGSALVATRRDASRSPIQAPSAEVRPRADRPSSRAEHATILRRIEDARSAVPTPPKGTLDPEYVRQGIEELLPLIQACFEDGLSRQEDLAGRVVLRFTITADPSVGGIITDSQIVDDKSTIADAAVRECIQESMYAARFAPPENGGDVEVEYPFALEP